MWTERCRARTYGAFGVLAANSAVRTYRGRVVTLVEPVVLGLRPVHNIGEGWGEAGVRRQSEW